MAGFSLITASKRPLWGRFLVDKYYHPIFKI
jgi:hypothetical protein